MAAPGCKYQGISSGFLLWDVRDFVDVKDCVLFFGSDINKADESDQHVMRDNMRIVTVVNTDAAGMGVELDGKMPPSYISRRYIKTSVLGYTLCELDLRAGLYTDRVVSQLSFKDQIWTAIERSTARTSDSSSYTQWDHIYQRCSVDDSWAYIVDSSETIGLIFNGIFADARCYPLILTDGHQVMLHSSILLMLLFLLIGAPTNALTHWHTQIMEILASEPGYHVVNPKNPLKARYRKSWFDQRSTWSSSIEKLIMEKYGGIEAYLRDAAGVEVATQQKIKRILLQKQRGVQKAA